ncbi:MAG: nucleoside transporter [Chitinivibrionales bacterium]|nr:nucleoside transporter [Chitinivibrionales bacterium]MBD3396328.1 nucleoside transporter [Chitinivibrionales bacterium]
MEPYNIVSFLGIFACMGTAWVFSTDRRRMNWHAIGWGIGLQLLFALFVFIAPAGTKAFLFVNKIAVSVLDAASEGAKCVFGPLALPPGTPGSLGFFLAFQALPTIIFFSALVSILYFYGIMPALIKFFARIFTRLMRVSGAESLCAASNIFVGVESAFTVRPHIRDMTRSELCTVLTAGMATVASNVLALYVFTLQKQFPAIAGHLISASFLSAPAALIMSKIMVPEKQTPRTLGLGIEPHYQKDSNVFEAVINGSQAGVKVIVGIVALLIAVLGLVALLDMILGGIGMKANVMFGWGVDWSLKGLLGYAFRPIAFILGIPPADVPVAARIIGQRAVLTEVASYQDLSAALAAGSLQHPRSAVIIAYALCGFAHVASMSIFVGGVSALAPGRTGTLSRVAFRALVAATLACLMTACVAGTFFTNRSVLLG